MGEEHGHSPAHTLCIAVMPYSYTYPGIRISGFQFTQLHLSVGPKPLQGSTLCAYLCFEQRTRLQNTLSPLAHTHALMPLSTAARGFGSHSYLLAACAVPVPSVRAVCHGLSSTNSTWWLLKLSNMSTITREWVAMQNAESSPFVDILLTGKPRYVYAC